MTESSCDCGGTPGSPPCIQCGRALDGAGERCPECGLNVAASNQAQAQMGPARREAFKVAFWLALIPLVMVLLRLSGFLGYIQAAEIGYGGNPDNGWWRAAALFAGLGAAAQCVMLPAYFILTTPEQSRWAKRREGAARQFVRYAAILQFLSLAASIATPGAIRAMVPVRFDLLRGEEKAFPLSQVFDSGLGVVFLITQVAITLAIGRMMKDLGKRVVREELQWAGSVTTIAAILVSLLLLVELLPSAVLWLVIVVQMYCLWRYTRLPAPMSRPV